MYPPIGLLLFREEFAESVNHFPSRDCNFIGLRSRLHRRVSEDRFNFIQHLEYKVVDCIGNCTLKLVTIHRWHDGFRELFS